MRMNSMRSRAAQVRITERSEAGHTLVLEFDGVASTRITDIKQEKSRGIRGSKALEFIWRAFLPSGYPESVSPDYLRYQIFNGLQAFCSSLAGLLSSRAVLEGFGVGDASASATHALLLTILQDVFSRLTTIIAAYYIGSSLFPEAKTYRLLADIFNDTAIALDTLSPLLNSPSLPFHLPGLRVAALCLSGSLRALCGIAAGGSKAALTVHFATPINGKGDVGDLNAKDASKETVLGLSGMLLGTLIVPYLTTPSSTYTALFLLIACHLAANHTAVRGLVLRSLNRQRTGIAWSAYRRTASRVLSPAQVSARERIFEWPGALQYVPGGGTRGHCTIGSSLSAILRRPIPFDVLQLFEHERYILWFDSGSLSGRPDAAPRLHICLKEGHAFADHLKAWVHAEEACRVWFGRRELGNGDDEEASAVIRVSYGLVEEHLPAFLERMRGVGWDTSEGGLLVGSPKSVLVAIQQPGSTVDPEVVTVERKKDL